jgi:hypothetical protein
MLANFDIIIYNALNKLLSCTLDLLQFGQASLPTKLGGLELTSAINNAPITFINSINTCLTLQQRILNNNSDDLRVRNIYNAMELIEETTSLDILSFNNAFNTFGIKGLNLKKVADQIKSNGMHSDYLNKTNFREAARILSVSGKYSMKWTNAFPMKNYGIKLNNSEFQIAARLALGCQQYPRSTKYCKMCNEITDLKGHHSTHCKKENSINKRHNEIRDYIYQITQGCLAISKEENRLFEGQERPADIYIAKYQAGKDFLFDVGISCPTSFNSAKNAAKIKNHAADAFAKAKTTKVTPKLVNTVPLIAETFGSWSDSSANQIKSMI